VLSVEQRFTLHDVGYAIMPELSYVYYVDLMLGMKRLICVALSFSPS
jgi:hypothetical protein